MNSKTLLIIFGMAVVTYIPRFLPFQIFSKMNLSKRMMFFLKCIPYSALGALILPDTFRAMSNSVFRYWNNYSSSSYIYI